MSKLKSKAELEAHKNKAINKIQSYIDNLINSSNPNDNGKADKLCYWLEDYINFLKYESIFTPSTYPKYKRGQIVKVHLGYNIGSEEGGLHYAIVIEKNNSIHSPVINIIPLTSIKKSTNINNIRKDRGQILLGNELYKMLDIKIKTLSQSARKQLNELDSIIMTDDNMKSVAEMISNLHNDLNLLSNMSEEILKMKKGSIALVGQITTISKIRIYNPKTKHDILSNIRISNEMLDRIDESIIKMCTKVVG